VTSTPEKTPEEIEREMARTRESLTNKVAALEQTVVGTIQNATESVTGTVDAVRQAVQDTVATVRDTVQETVSSVKGTVADSVNTVADTVKGTFDITARVQAQPWLAVGVAATAGFFTGFLLGGSNRRRSLGATASMPEEQMHGFAPRAAAPPQSREAEKPGLFDELLARAWQLVRQLGDQALDRAIAAVRQNIDTAVPNLVEAAVGGLVPAVGAAMAGGRQWTRDAV